MKPRGLFVTLDGPGGVGKTTTTRALSRLLTRHGHHVHATTEPSHAELGTIARTKNSTYSGHALACLVAADRYHHLATEIRPHLDAGYVVICDRYVPASYVLQRMDGVPLDFIEHLNAVADIPDLAVILTAEPAETTARIDRRGTRHRFETGPVSAQLEADLYDHATQRLAVNGYPLLTIDTTHTPAPVIAERIAEQITRRTGLPHSRRPNP
jgi:dTMP kinase